MTHCRHWQRAHSSGPSLLSGFAVSAHRAEEEETEREKKKQRVGQREGERQRERRGERGTTINITVKPFRQQIQLCHTARQTNVGEMGPIFDGAKGLFSCITDSQKVCKQEKIALWVLLAWLCLWWKHALWFNWSGKGYDHVNTLKCRRRSRPQHLPGY